MVLIPITLMYAVLLLASVSAVDNTEIPEPHCSKYAFEERVLEKLVRMEHHVQLMDEKLQRFEKTIDQSLGDVKQQHNQLEGTKQSLTSYVQDAVSKVQADATETLKDVQKKVEEMNITDGQIRAFMENVTTTLHREKGVMFKATDVVDKSPSDGSLIRYSTTVVNVGGAYNTNTGYFTAPYDGLYTFNVQICTSSNKFLEVHIMAAGNVVGAFRKYDDGYDCSSGDGLAELAAGDQVWVKCADITRSGTVMVQDTWRWNSFSGMLYRRTG